jgi:sortase A
VLLKALEFALWTIGSILLMAWAAVSAWGESERRHHLAAFELALASPEANPDQTLWSDARKDHYAQAIEIDAGAPLGILRIAKIALEVPVFDGASEINMNRGAARIEGTAQLNEQGNVGIAGHRDGFFRRLKDLEVGDVLQVETLTGARQYRIESLTIVDPHQVEVLDPTETNAITLVTCYPFYFIGHAPQRYIVRAVIDV